MVDRKKIKASPEESGFEKIFQVVEANIMNLPPNDKGNRDIILSKMPQYIFSEEELSRLISLVEQHGKLDRDDFNQICTELRGRIVLREVTENLFSLDNFRVNLYQFISDGILKSQNETVEWIVKNLPSVIKDQGELFAIRIAIQEVLEQRRYGQRFVINILNSVTNHGEGLQTKFERGRNPDYDKNPSEKAAVSTSNNVVNVVKDPWSSGTNYND